MTTKPDVRSGLASRFRTRERSLRALAFGLTGSAVAAEDIVQDVFAAMSARLPEFADERAAAAYLHAAVTNRCRSHHRRGYVRRRYEASLRR